MANAWVWSRIEAELFLVFMAASGLARCMSFSDTEHRETLARTFFAVKGMEIRLGMTHVLAQQRWKKSPHLATWTPIHNELNAQRKVRGKIGHSTGLLFSNPRGKPPTALLIDPRLYVDIAVDYKDAKNGGKSLVQLLQIHQDFLSLQRSMADFVFSLSIEQHLASPQPQAGPPLPPHTQDDQTSKESR